MRRQQNPKKSHTEHDIIKESNLRLVTTTLIIAFVATIACSLVLAPVNFRPIEKVADFFNELFSDTTVTIDESFFTDPEDEQPSVSFEQRITSLLDNLTESGRLERAYIGIKYATVTDDIIEKYHLDTTYGAYIGEVLKDSPAEKSKLKVGDVITHIDGQRITADNPLNYVIAKHNIGDWVAVTYVRNGETRVAKITLSGSQKQ